jgi:NAD(P)H-dependent FMN reductase
MKVLVISSTVRPGRRGPVVAQWVVDQLNQNEAFEATLLDLGEFHLPLMNEVNHPRLQKYELEHSKAFSEQVKNAEAFVMVTGEYDHTYPAPLKNALEYLVFEWQFKVSGIVSYSGGYFAGVRAADKLKGDLMSKKVVPLMETVHIPNVDQLIQEKKFQPTEAISKSLGVLEKALIRWNKGMEVIRANA